MMDTIANDKGRSDRRSWHLIFDGKQGDGTNIKRAAHETGIRLAVIGSKILGCRFQILPAASGSGGFFFGRHLRSKPGSLRRPNRAEAHHPDEMEKLTPPGGPL